jgi:hypothetical protein
MIDREEAITLLGGPKRKLPNNPRTPEEILAAMKAASANYYREAIATNCHTFIEFTGLMSQYISICERNLKEGVDFTQISVHHTGGLKLHITDWELEYLAQKLKCIFPELQLVKTESVEITATDK